jgi:hypothetical protein
MVFLQSRLRHTDAAEGHGMFFRSWIEQVASLELRGQDKSWPRTGGRLDVDRNEASTWRFQTFGNNVVIGDAAARAE